MAFPMGSIIGFVLPAFMVGELDEDPEKEKRNVYLFIWVQCIIVTIANIPLLIFAQEKPPSPPSFSATKPPTGFNFKVELKELIKNRNFILLTLAFGAMYGTSACLSAVVSSLTLPFGYRSKDNSIFGAVFIIAGVAGCAASGIIIDRTHKFKQACIYICVLTTATFVLLFFVAPTGSVALLSLNFLFMGLGIIPILPVCFAFGVELTYPVPEAMSNGMMIVPSKIYGSILGVIAGYIVHYGPFYCLGLFLANTGFAVVVSFFIKEDLRRLNLKQSL